MLMCFFAEYCSDVRHGSLDIKYVARRFKVDKRKVMIGLARSCSNL